MGNSVIGLTPADSRFGPGFELASATTQQIAYDDKRSDEFGSEEYEKRGVSHGIMIEGAIGSFACCINKNFMATGKLCNNRMLYRSFDEPYQWLRYATTKRWMVSSTKDKNANLWGGFCFCQTVGLADPSHTVTWSVFGGQGVFTKQTDLKATALDKSACDELRQTRMVEQRKVMVDAVPRRVNVSGATGLLAYKINGVYECRSDQNNLDETFNKKNIYYRFNKKATNAAEIAITYDYSKRWIVGQSYGRNTILLAYSAVSGLYDPCEATRWYVSTTSGRCHVQPCMEMKYIHSEKPKLKKILSNKCLAAELLMERIVADPKHKNRLRMVADPEYKNRCRSLSTTPNTAAV